MASFLAKSKTKSETSSSTLQVQFKEIPNEDVGQDETLSEVIAVLEWQVDIIIIRKRISHQYEMK
jgi:hypothetical protein